jgi:hypothetical protein
MIFWTGAHVDLHGALLLRQACVSHAFDKWLGIARVLKRLNQHVALDGECGLHLQGLGGFRTRHFKIPKLTISGSQIKVVPSRHFLDAH